MAQRMMACVGVALCVVAVMQLLAVPCQSQDPGAAAGFARQAGVPQACIDSSLAIQSACGTELQSILQSTGSTADPNNVGALLSAAQTAVQSGAAEKAIAALNPSPGCCKASCEFTRQLCGCNEQVTNLVTQGLGVDAGAYGRLLSQFASKCGFPALARATGNCPATASFTC